MKIRLERVGETTSYFQLLVEAVYTSQQYRRELQLNSLMIQLIKLEPGIKGKVEDSIYLILA